MAIGGSFTVNRLPIRLIAGAWSLAAFVFVQAYTSTLITYIVAPTNRPLISSFNQLTERPDIHLVMKDLGLLEHLLRVFFSFKLLPLILFLSNNLSFITLWRILKISDDGSKLVENLKTRENKIKCNLQSECFDLVKPGTKNVYIDVNIYVFIQYLHYDILLNKLIKSAGKTISEGCHQTTILSNKEMWYWNCW